MTRPLDAGSNDPNLAGARADAKLEFEQARARREKVKADQAEGRVILKEDAIRQIQELALGVRQQLDRVNSYLPSDLTPENRAICEAAMGGAIAAALATMKEPTND